MSSDTQRQVGCFGVGLLWLTVIVMLTILVIVVIGSKEGSIQYQRQKIEKVWGNGICSAKEGDYLFIRWFARGIWHETVMKFVSFDGERINLIKPQTAPKVLLYSRTDMKDANYHLIKNGDSEYEDAKAMFLKQAYGRDVFSFGLYPDLEE